MVYQKKKYCVNKEICITYSILDKLDRIERKLNATESLYRVLKSNIP